MVDLVVRRLGVFLPMPLVLPYCAAWARKQGCPPPNTFWIGHWRSVRRQDDKRVTALFFVILILRVAVYVPIRWGGLNEFVSDHVFLVCSLVAQIQIMQGAIVARDDDAPPRARARRAARLYCLLLLALFLVEVVTTSHTYHTREASWAGYVTGTIMFTGIAFWATRKAGDAPGEQALLGGGTREASDAPGKAALLGGGQDDV